jgi:superfamily I DNA/RNA helicase
VGDDWQSIYRFAGSDVDIFVNFENYFKNPTISYLDNNYRSSELIVKVAGQLISNNKNQRTKKVKALKKISKTSINLKVVKQVLDEEAYMKKECELIYKKINKLLKNNIKASEIMILARFNKPIRLIKSKLETEIDSELLDKLKIMTVHRAKGSQAKYVFIMDMIDGDDGFPSERKDDSVLDFIKPDIVDNGFEEERRLFYVALTRAKEHIYIYTQEGRESMFLGEIEDYLKVG